MRFLLAGLCAAALSFPATAQDPSPRPARVFWTPEAPQQGDPLLVEVVPRGEAADVGGTFAGRRLRFFSWGPGRWRALAPISVKSEAGDHELTVVVVRPGGEREVDTRPVTVSPTEFPTSELRVDPRFTKPPARFRKQIRADRRRIKRAWTRTKNARLWRGSFVSPLENRETSPFGTQRVFNDRVASRHLGVDIDGAVGDPVTAAAGGRVVLSHHLYYSGRTVFIDHGLGLFTVYFHLSALDVTNGEWVEAGQRIGLVGRSGRVTGPHLHFGVKLSGVYVNPQTLLELDLGADPLVPATTAQR